jgi:hypothetical protein
MLDRIDSGAGGRLDAARAVGVGGDFQAQAVGGGDDGAHFIIIEMLVEAAALLAEYAAGGGKLDDIGAALAGFAHPGGAFDCAGAGVALVERVVHCRRESRHIAVAANDRQRGAGRQDARAGEHPAVDGIAHGKASQSGAAQIAHRGEPGLGGCPRIFQAIGDRQFGAVDRFAPERRARITGQVDMRVDQARAERAR